MRLSPRLLFLSLLFPVGFYACAGSEPPLIAVQVAPLCVTMQPGGSANFQATIFVNNVDQGVDNAAVNWSVLGGDVNGIIDQNGSYQSPNTVPPPTQQVQIIATSKEDDQKSGEASVILMSTPSPSPDPCTAPPFS